MILIALATVLANPVTLPAALVAALPGDRIVLAAGDYPAVRISGISYTPAITIDARRANVAGLNIETAAGVVWSGGTIRAPGGMDGFAAAGYAVRLVDVQRVTIRAAIITDAKKGLVLAGADSAGVVVQGVAFTGLREDGIIASQAANVAIAGNSFTDFRPRPIDHPDAIQIRDGMDAVRITGNRIDGVMQGIGQMEAKTDRPLSRITITGNTVRTGSFHSITLYACDRCTVTGNDIGNLTPDRKSFVKVIAPGTRACGNIGTAGVEAVKPC